MSENHQNPLKIIAQAIIFKIVDKKLDELVEELKSLTKGMGSDSDKFKLVILEIATERIYEFLETSKLQPWG